MTNLIAEVRGYVESHYPIICLSTFEEGKADAIVNALAEGRKVLEWNLAYGHVDFATKRPLSAEPAAIGAALRTFHEMDPDRHFIVIKDAHLALQEDAVAVARLKALANKIINDQRPDAHATIFLVSNVPYVPPELEKLVTLVDVPLPDQDEIGTLIARHSKHLGEQPVPEDALDKLTVAFRGLSEHEIKQLLNRGVQQDGQIDEQDLALVLSEKKQIIRRAGILEMLASTETLDGIGGLEQLKQWLRQKAKVLARLSEAERFGVEAPKGVMIVGMPGCGKSLTAKAASALFGIPLLRLDVGSLFGKYVGESEANMRKALKVAEAISPCVLYIDELEKAFAGMGGGGGSSDVATRLFGFFLSWMQDRQSPVFVIATANDITALPPELLRKGRFDETFYVDFPTATERQGIFEIHLKRRRKSVTAIELKKLAAMTDGFTGADIESAVKEAVERAFIDNKALVTTALLLQAIEDTQPLKEVMKDKVREYADKFSRLRIKSAS